MSKPFGQYLLEKGIVDATSLLEALVEQQEATPSVASIIFKNKLLPPEMQLAVLNMQNEKSYGYRDACRELGFWTADIENRVHHIVQDARRPLGQILVMKGKATFQDLTRALDEYVFDVTPGNQGQASVARVAEPSQTVAGVRLKSTGEFDKSGDLRNSLFNEYFKFVTVDQYNEIEKIFESWPLLFGRSLVASIEQIRDMLAQMGAAARFIQATHSLEIILGIDQLLHQLATHVEVVPKPVVEQVVSRIMDGIELLWKIRHFMEMDLSENGFWGEAPQRNRFEKISQSLVDLTTNISNTSALAG